MTEDTKTKGAVQDGANGQYVFELPRMAGIDAGTGCSTAVGPMLEGERIVLRSGTAGVGRRRYEVMRTPQGFLFSINTG